MIRFLTTIALCLGLAALAYAATAADEEAEIKRIMQAHLDDINNERSAEIARHHLPGHSEYSANGRPLGISGSFEEQLARNDAIFDGGFTFDWHHKDLNVQIFGDAAVVTGYVVGTTNPPNADPISINNRRTTVLLKRQGKWQEIHVHNSPLIEQTEQ